MIKHKTLDKIGITASSACALHCLLAPILITVAPLIGLGFVFSKEFETTFILSTLGIAFLSLIWGFYSKHQNFLPIFILLLGAALVVITRMDSIMLSFPEPIVMGLAGVSIASSHIINLKLCQHCEDCGHHD